MKKSDSLSLVTSFFDEAVATNARQKIFMVLFCGLGATLFSTGLVIGTTKNENRKSSKSNLGQE